MEKNSKLSRLSIYFSSLILATICSSSLLMASTVPLHDSHRLLVATFTQLWAIKRADDSCDSTSIFSRSSNFTDASNENSQSCWHKLKIFKPITSFFAQSGDFWKAKKVFLNQVFRKVSKAYGDKSFMSFLKLLSLLQRFTCQQRRQLPHDAFVGVNRTEMRACLKSFLLQTNRR